MKYELKDWEDALVIPEEPEEGFEKEGPETALGSLWAEGHSELFHPPEQFRPSLFDTQIAAVALAAQQVWDEMLPVMGQVLVRYLQLERVEVQKYSHLDPSEVEEGTVFFRVEAEANYPQYRRAMLTVPVRIIDGRPVRGLFFYDGGGNRWPMTEKALEQHLGVREWFTLTRQPRTPRAQIDRLVEEDFPHHYERSKLTWDIGF